VSRLRGAKASWEDSEGTQFGGDFVIFKKLIERLPTWPTPALRKWPDRHEREAAQKKGS